MTNSIFVAQTFNGEKMVNANQGNRKAASSANVSPSTPHNTNTTPIAPHPPVNTSPSSKDKNCQGKNQIKVKPQPRPYKYQYWSEANVAVLIQLHRKHYSGLSSEDTHKSKAAWTILTTEYTSITSDQRTLPDIKQKWDQLLAKYNAERACLMMQHRQSGLQQPLPVVSYWNHFQYMDLYLSHLPVPENALDYDEDSVQSHKRKREETEEGHSVIKHLLDTQQMFMEQSMNRQEAQIQMIKDNYESMTRMNMRYVDMCERLTNKTQANEDRYMSLLDKISSLEKQITK
ncbi:uncharacterized protein B0P05DRAFT_576378 [Gilbertella persicaria]|uniref:Myb/SANT-like DNA-binding domain-containing protein n=1 Tax=Rhizopus stolonifer TaxID=4846 RepID=A0A367JR16_RHIST|nr:uncharacterized protein B0P05DRAFT_576378 [Gilbertella persicaria]KAI8047296.1 hypothetical protein B0P05DRAFT_576378 [Gilbertella persicaria]RCH92346.1 hypothetical protein CU098_010154 [Rhizopus stolonifer]